MPPAGGPGRHHRGGGGGFGLGLSPPAGGVSSPRLRWRPSPEGARPGPWAFAARAGPGRGRGGRAAPWRGRHLAWLGGGLLQAAWLAWAVLRRGRPGGAAGLRVAAVCADTG